MKKPIDPNLIYPEKDLTNVFPEEGSDLETFESYTMEWTPTSPPPIAPPPPPKWEWDILGTTDFVLRTPHDYSWWVRFWATVFFKSKWKRLSK